MPDTHEFARAAADAAETFRPGAGPRDGATSPAGVPPLRIVEPARLQGRPVPVRRWLVAGWLPWHQTASLYGDGGTGKTLLAQMLGTCCATGLAWLGLETAGVKVLAVFCEDSEDELHIRQNDINRHYGITFSNLKNFRWISRVGEDNLLMTFGADGVGVLTPFWHQVADAAKAFGAQLVILDTAADTFGGNENSRPQVRQFIQQACTRLAREIDGAVLLCAHPSAAGLASGDGGGGSTQWSNAVRSRLFLSRPPAEDGQEPDDNLRILTRKKSNYSARGDEITLRWEAGAFQVLHAKAPDAVDRIEGRTCERDFLAALEKLKAEGRDVSAKRGAPNNAALVMARMPMMTAWRRAEIDRAMQSLLDAGRIVQAPFGPPSRRWSRLEIVPQMQPISGDGPKDNQP